MLVLRGVLRTDTVDARLTLDHVRLSLQAVSGHEHPGHHSAAEEAHGYASHVLHPHWRDGLQLLGITIGTAALCFQVRLQYTPVRKHWNKSIRSATNGLPHHITPFGLHAPLQKVTVLSSRTTNCKHMYNSSQPFRRFHPLRAAYMTPVQVGVLFPWHEELSAQFSELESVVHAQSKQIAELQAAAAKHQ